MRAGAQQCVGRRHHVQEAVLREPDTFVHVRRRELDVKLTVDEVVPNTLASVCWVRVHAHDLDVTMHRFDARSNLVERRNHILCGVTPHRAGERVPGHLGSP